MSLKDLITVVIPVKEKPEVIKKFINMNLAEVFHKCRIIVIDSKGGEELMAYSNIYERKHMSMTEARKYGYSLVTTPYILNLDSDNIIPKGYLDVALLMLMNNKDIVVVALDYEKSIGHLGYGTSLWKTEILKKLYDYDEKIPTLRFSMCECTYMWTKVLSNNYKIGTLNMKAKHLKELS